MNPRFKRLLSMLLALTVIFSLFTPVTAFAADTTSADENTVEIEVGESTKLKVYGWYSKTTWTSSDESVAVVSSDGTVTGVAPGAVTIVAVSRSFFSFMGSKTTAYTVVVTEPEEGMTVKAGETLQLTVDADGGNVTWTSSDESIATVDGNGTVTGVAEGDVVITATVKKTTGGNRFWFFWWGGQTSTTTTQFEVTVLPGDEQPTEPEVPTEPEPTETEPEPTETEPEPTETEPEVVTYTVTFESNGGSDVEAQVVVEGMTAVEPAEPTNGSQVFTGWYTDEALTQVYDFATPVTADITLYAGWYNEFGYVDEDEIANEPVEGGFEGGSTVNAIIDLEIVDQTAILTVSAVDDAILYVEILSDDAELNLLAEGAANVSAGVEMAEIAVVLDGELPEFYYVQASLMDFNGNILTTFLFIDYTSAYAEFMAQTIYDFEDRTVLNFDEDPTNNFGVLAETVVQTQADDVTVAEDGSYVFPASEGILELAVGDAVLVNLPDAEPLLFKVGTITENGDGTITIAPETEDITLDEFYEVLKVDMNLVIDESMIDMSEATEGITLNSVSTQSHDALSPMADVEIEADPSVKLDFGGEIKLSEHWKGVIGLTAGLDVDLEIVYDIKLFSKDYFRVSVVSGFEGGLSVDIMLHNENDEPTGEGKQVFKVKFGKVRVPFGVTGLQGVLEPTAPLEWSLEGGLNVEVTFKNKSGFIYESGKDRQDVSKKSIDVNFGLKGKAEIKFGPKVVLGITFLETVVKAELSAYAGAKAEATADMGLHATTGDSVHSCGLCLDGEAGAFVEVKAELKYKITDDFKGTPFSLKLVDLEFHLFDFYFSILNSSDSMFGGIPHFGKEDCPNQKFKVTFEAKDTAGNTVTPDLSFTRLDNNKDAGTLTRDEDYFQYFYPGNFLVKAKIDGTNVEKRFSVSDEPITVTLSSSERDGTVSGTVSEAEDHSKLVSGATVKICQGNTVCATATTDANGSYKVSMPAGNYEILITADGYIPFTCQVTVTQNNDVHTPTFLMIAESDEKYGGISGTITNAVTGAPLGGVDLVFRKGWNNTNGDFVLGLETDSDGYYSYELRSFLGAKIGLAVGNYTVTMSKDGYITSYFNVVILPSKTTGNQNNSLTPEANEGEYRIVLTWGSTPSDLDSHYRAVTTSGSVEHVYYGNMSTSTAMLDVDDTSSYGPETTTITDFDSVEEFVFSVYDYTNGGDSSNTQLASSGAVVKLYKGDVLLETYNVPGGGKGDTWHVFRITSDGTITGINQFCTTGSSSDVGVEILTAASGAAVAMALNGMDIPKR